MKYTTILDGIPSITTKVTSTDTAQTLDTTIDQINSYSPISILITCETNDIRFAFGVNPTTALGHIIYATYSIVLNNPKSIRDFRFISETAGAHGDLMVTAFYEIGRSLA